ncbi:hypothetical protein D910_02053 [Dendroctonus ponderosae]|uniref:Insertion element IS150 protein InsJ-like helix-turn-helix domain-containing protein n=1 Tax=Dendroctonus ponderosae TaxID=77166 RepID=U4U3S1_DENPD|nr:hypothetical protein D910_02053 [Dendroctonus ponderosae]
MSSGRHFSEFDAVKIVTLFEEGNSQGEAARRLGVHHTTIRQYRQRFRKTGCHARRPGQGRPRSTNHVDDRFLPLQALRNRRLNGSGLTAKHPAKGPLLTIAYKQARLEFAPKHVDWNLDYWKKVLFTDEVRLGLKSSDGRAFIWRKPGERYSQGCMVPQLAFRGASIMFGGGISFEARTDLAVIRGRSLTSQKYIQDILENHVVPFALYISGNLFFMDDNARPHRALIVREYLNECRQRVVLELNWKRGSSRVAQYTPRINGKPFLWHSKTFDGRSSR